jgi:hypothetical protein
MIESWNRTEKIIAFEWAIEKQALLKDDERTDDFIFNWIFNDSSDTKQKQKVMPSRKSIRISRLGQYLSIVLTIGVMVGYILIDNQIASMAAIHQQELEAQPEHAEVDGGAFRYTVYTYLNSFAYSFVLICLNQLNGTLSQRINDAENHRFQSVYENSMITKLFSINFFNFYFPMFLVAFLKFFQYNDLVSLVVT